MTHDEEEAVLAQADAIKKSRSEKYLREAKEIKERVESGTPPFTDDELRYAATARCKCDAGFAYPEKSGPHGMWVCSALLKSGERSAEAQAHHDAAMPFMFWSVKDEGQPSAGGRTTRPGGVAKPLRAPDA
jgi:hypothetical protein